MSSNSRITLDRVLRLGVAIVVLLALGEKATSQNQHYDSERLRHGAQWLECEHIDANDSGPVYFSLFDMEQDEHAQWFRRETSPIRQATMLQPTPFLEPSIAVRETPSPSPIAGPISLSSQLFERANYDRSILRTAKIGVRSLSVDRVFGAEAAPLTSTDVGSLLKKSSTSLSTEVQARTPVVNDPRVRSSRVGSLAASGSHWVPAREDLDTAVSKIDSRLIDDIVVVPGPYSSLYGPGFQFIDFELLSTPRFTDGNEAHGRSSLDFNANGNQWLGQQSIWAGGRDWGVRGDYTYRSGEDYLAGDGTTIPSGYNSQQFKLAIGRDLTGGSTIELTLLRLDQTDVVFPGYVFDMDYLVTDGYEVSYVDPNPTFADQVETDIWYNRTRFNGNAQNLAKRPQFPLLDRISYVGFTDVDSMSTGYRRGRAWGSAPDSGLFTIGHDLRFIKQELNEISSGTSLGLPIPFADRNSPIPKSFSVNPGIFTEYNRSFANDWVIKTGARLDYVQTDITAPPEDLNEVGLDTFPASYEEIVGTSQKQTDRMMWSVYGTLSRQHNESLVTSTSIGYAERAPNLTSLYAAQPFLLLLQNGLNNVTGDPTLEHEKLLQADMSFDFDGDYLRAGARGFMSWAFDYLTFENTNVVQGPPSGDVQQVSLRYVNTEYATIAGVESFVELLPRERISPFLNLRYTEGTDRKRKGDFATTNGQQGFPSTKVNGLPRGFFSGVVGGSSEPLPGISPFEARVGFRLRDSTEDPSLNIKYSARIVASQNRVAESLLETPTAGFVIHDIRTTFRPEFSENLIVIAGIENFTDRAYREHLDFRSLTGISVLQPGINFYLGTDFTY